MGSNALNTTKKDHEVLIDKLSILSSTDDNIIKGNNAIREFHKKFASLYILEELRRLTQGNVVVSGFLFESFFCWFITKW
jgi:hypothetical protein